MGVSIFRQQRYVGIGTPKQASGSSVELVHKMKKYRYILLLMIFVLLAGSFGVLLYVRSHTKTTNVLGSTSDTPTYKFADNTLGVYADIPTRFTKNDTPAQTSKSILVIFEAGSAGDQYGPISLSISIESGLKLPAKLQKEQPLDVVVGNLDKTIKQKYPGYTKISEKKYTIGTKSVVKYDFSYTGKNDLKATQRLIIVERDQDSVVYFKFQTLTDTFDSVEKDFLRAIESSITVK